MYLIIILFLLLGHVYTLVSYVPVGQLQVGELILFPAQVLQLLEVPEQAEH